MNTNRLIFGTAGALSAALLFSSGPVAAQGQSASAEAMLEEIVVTARRREETLADLPLSVAAITADAMQAQGIYDIMDVSNFVPNVNFTHTGRRAITALYIRGIGNSSPIPLRATGAGIYIDGHYLPNTVGQMLNTVDVERIEVMRGPQGTLFGKNTTGGAINVVSAKPGPEFESSLLTRVGEYGQNDFRGMINLPMSDQVSTRFSFAKETSDGYSYNRTLGETWGQTDLTAFAGAIRLTPNDNWMIDFGVRSNRQDDQNAPGRCNTYPSQAIVDNLATDVNVPGARGVVHPAQIYTGPVYANGRNQWGGSVKANDGNRYNVGGHVERLGPGTVLKFWEACDADAAAGDFVFSSEKRSFLELDNTNVNLTIQWDSAGETAGFDNLNMKVIASQHQTDYNYFQDRDFSPIAIDAIGTGSGTPGGEGRDRQTKSFEMLLTADVNQQLSFIGGYHYYDDYVINGYNCLDVTMANYAKLSDKDAKMPDGTTPFNIDCTPDGGTQFDWLSYPRQMPGGPEASGRAGNVSAESWALFGHVTYEVAPTWILDAGIRATTEDRGFHQIEFAGVGGSCKFGDPGDPDPTEMCAINYNLNYESMFLDGFYNDQEATFEATTPMISLTKDLDNSMMYVSYSEGFLSGAFNDELNVFFVPELAPLLTYDPEFVSNYEFGFKGNLADGRLRYSAAVFYMDYRDKHEQINIDNADGKYGNEADIGIVTNAAEVDIYGIEFELRAAPWDGGFVSLDVGYLSSEYGSFDSFDLDAGVIDNSLLSIADFSPAWTINASIEHAFLLGNGATVTPNMGMYYQDDYDFVGGLDTSTDEKSYCFQPAYAKFRARATYMPAEGNWQASLFGSNISDERYFDWCGNGRAGAMFTRFGAPAMWGLEFMYNWGG